MTTEEWCTKAEAARHLRMSVKTIERYVRDGKLPSYRIGGVRTVRFKRSDLDALAVPVDIETADCAHTSA